MGAGAEVSSILTRDGGLAVQLENQTGAVSVRGSLVCPHKLIPRAVILAEAGDYDPVGVVLDDGVPEGSPFWVVVSGTAYVLLEDGTAAQAGSWCRTSENDDGRADASQAIPNPINGNPHAAEIGHVLDTVEAGTSQLCLLVLHFN